MKTRTFKTTVVLTVATGVTLGEDLRLSDITGLIQWLSGGKVYTHQMPLVREEAEKAAQVALGDAWEPLEEGADLRAYQRKMLDRLGETMEIAPAAKPFHREDAIEADAIERVCALTGSPPNIILIVDEEPPHG